ncbi:MAG: hypothetical protein O2930_05255 [Acidobacteria bacterium]|nr:hypothetical protein [Acidobacteriota bacterium]
MAGSRVGAAHDIDLLEADLKRLETEYQMFFGGRLPRPPWETRSRVEALVTRLDRTPPTNFGERFRFTSLQSRFRAFIDLWDRGVRAREEGRPGPFAGMGADRADEPPPAPAAATDRLLAVATLSDPMAESDKLRSLFEGLTSARHEVGQPDIPFERFAALVGKQVGTFRAKGCHGVAFRVGVKDGKVSFTARPASARESEE